MTPQNPDAGPTQPDDSSRFFMESGSVPAPSEFPATFLTVARLLIAAVAVTAALLALTTIVG